MTLPPRAKCGCLVRTAATEFGGAPVDEMPRMARSFRSPRRQEGSTIGGT
jgi:hypothetical protein